MKTLDEFIVEKQSDYSHARGDLTGLLSSIRLLAKIIHYNINRAGLSADITGFNGSQNIQGEQQMKLDRFAHEQMMSALMSREEVAGIASEEEDSFVFFNTERGHNAKYVILTDPLDGSTNIDVNVSVGTIFSIFRRISPEGSPVELADFLQPGHQQVAAGYVIYGSSTMLVYTTGNGVNGFTYDPGLGTFYLSHANMRIPEQGSIYSLNEGQYLKFPTGVKKYIKYCQAEDPESNRPYSSRYIGSLVSDIHRNMLKGGIFIYPVSTNYPQGKLRLLYECNPIAFIIEQAGGIASDGAKRILDIIPTELHQRTPFFVGSSQMVRDAERFMREYPE